MPAVLKYNRVPCRLLLEVGNLNNREDRKLITTRQFRQKMAEVIVQAILDYYGERDERRDVVARRSSL